MLATMRKTAGGLLAKALLLFLVLTFGVWGIGDMLNRSGNREVARVGKERITPAEFEGQLRNAASASKLPPELTNSAMFKQQVLQSMIERSLLLQEARREGLRMDTAQAAKIIARTKEFRAKDGSFDKRAFASFLAQNNMSEARFVETLKQDRLAQILVQSLSLPTALPFPALASGLSRAQGAGREIALFTLKARPPESVSIPDDGALKSFYSGIKNDYLTPERRTLDYVILSPEALEKALKSEISETDIADRYATDKAQFATPESRDLTQWIFPDETSAAQSAAASAPTGGKRSVLTAITQSRLTDAIAKAAFSLKEGEISEPIQTSFGWHRVRVDRITPVHTPALHEVKDKLISTLVAERRDEWLEDTQGRLEDALASGDTITKAAKSLGIESRSGTLSEIDQAGQQAGGKGVPSEAAFVVTRGFALGEGETSPFESTPDKKLISVTVRDIAPQAPKPLDEVKTEILARYKREQAELASSEAAQKAVASLRASDKTLPEGVSRSAASKVILAEALGEDTKHPLPSALRRILFDTPIGEFTSPVKRDNGDWVFAKILRRIEAPQTSKEAALSSAERAEIGNSVYEDYMQHLLARYPVKINEAYFAEAKETSND